MRRNSAINSLKENSRRLFNVIADRARQMFNVK